MDLEFWRRIRPLVEEALDLDPGQRSRFVAKIENEQPELAVELKRLIALQSPNNPLDEGVQQLVATAVVSELEGDPPFRLPAGERIGNYVILGEIGFGGMGAVYRAHRLLAGVGQTVALKLMREEWTSSSSRSRFEQEQKILAGLKHPNIAQMLDAGETDEGQPYFTMEYVEGLPITTYCERHGLSLEQRLGLISRTASALAYAHQNLVVHRDIKPSNILVAADGEPKLLDFGISKLIDTARQQTLTVQQHGPMTPEYAAPEQFKGGTITAATDVYQLGTLMYRLLTNAFPFAADPANPLDWSRAVCEREPDSLKRGLARTTGRGTESSTARFKSSRIADRDLNAILMKALSKEPDARYRSMDAFNADIEAFLSLRSVSANRPGGWQTARKFFQRNRVPVAAAMLASIALIAGTAVALWQSANARAAALAAEREADYARQVSDFLIRLFEVSDPGENRGQRLTADVLLETGAKRVEAQKDNPLLAGRLALVIGNVYKSLGEYSKAEPFADKAVADLRRADTPALEMAKALRDSAFILTRRGRSEDALPMLQEADLALAESDDDSDAIVLERAQIEASRAVALKEMGRFEESMHAYDRAIPVLQQWAHRVPQIQTSLGAAYNNQGLLLLSLDHKERAALAFERALIQHTAVLGPEHPRVLGTKANLASVLTSLGEARKALALIEDVVAIEERIYDGKGANFANDVAVLGLVRLEMNQIEGARQALQRAQRVLAQAGLAERPNHFFIQMALAEADLRSGDARAALANLEGVVEHLLVLLGPADLGVVEARMLRARVLLALGRAAEARAEVAALAAVSGGVSAFLRADALLTVAVLEEQADRPWLAGVWAWAARLAIGDSTPRTWNERRVAAKLREIAATPSRA